MIGIVMSAYYEVQTPTFVFEFLECVPELLVNMIEGVVGRFYASISQYPDDFPLGCTEWQKQRCAKLHFEHVDLDHPFHLSPPSHVPVWNLVSGKPYRSFRSAFLQAIANQFDFYDYLY